MNQNKDYFCENCDRRIKPYELETSTKDGVKAWKHKACKKHMVIRIDPEEPKPEKIVDLFED